MRNTYITQFVSTEFAYLHLMCDVDVSATQCGRADNGFITCNHSCAATSIYLHILRIIFTSGNPLSISNIYLYVAYSCPIYFVINFLLRFSLATELKNRDKHA